MTGLVNNERQDKGKPDGKRERDELVYTGNCQNVPDIIYCRGGSLLDIIYLKRGMSRQTVAMDTKITTTAPSVP